MSLYSTLVRNPLLATISNHLDGYPSPINLSYLWGFGSLAGIALVVQIVTGVLLAMHYAPEVHIAFSSVEHIMRDVRGGVALRYIHANGASMFFIVVYTHMFRGLYYGSYFQPRSNLWYSGIVIFFLMMATAFMGYVLPWGQMSFWGATVITNLFSAIPGIGNSIVQLLWGGFSVDNPTLNRFFSLHYLLPFAIAGVALLHLILLHQPGSNNPLGISSVYDRIPFYPYFYVKDLFGFFIFVWLFSFFVIYAPNYMGHPDNYIEANPLVTPAHIVPEWYFLPFYAILRTIPDKLGGVILMAIAIVVLAILPVVDTSSFRSTYFKPINLWFFWYFFADSVSLGWIGQEIVESPFIEMANFVTLSYFLYFIPLLPLTGFLENAVIRTQLRHSVFPLFAFFTLPSLKNSTDFATPPNKSFPESVRFFDFSEKISDFESPMLAVGEARRLFEHERVESPYHLSPYGNMNAFFPKENYIEISSLNGGDFLSFFFSWIHVFQLILIVLFILFLGIFFSKSSAFIRFLNKISFGYLIFNFWRMSLDVVLRPTVSTSFIKKENLDFFEQNNSNTISGHFNDLEHYAFAILQADSLLAKLFTVYSIVMVSIFLYGISDRFFIANSSEIEFPVLVFFIHLGALLLFFVHNFVDFVLAIETVTLASYALAAFERKNRFSTFAGVQYFILGSIPSGMLVLGIALLYKNWGSLALEDLDLILTSVMPVDTFNGMDILSKHFDNKIKFYPEALRVCGLHPMTREWGLFLDPREFNFLRGWDATVSSDFELLSTNNFTFFSLSEWESLFAGSSPYTYATVVAVIFILFNLLFKITAAPFHFWAPSVYGKAPIASVTFLSIFSKGMIFFILFKILFTIFHSFRLLTIPFLLFCSVISVLFGMVGAFSEKVIKRFFVYSSMGHVGFMLLGLSVSSLEGASTTFHYLPVYIISSFIMWFTLLHMGRENNHIVHFKILKNSDPLLALIFALLVFSMSGIPPLGGFFIKLDVLSVLLENSRFYTNYILLLFTVASFFYYLRLIKIIFFDESKVFSRVRSYNDERLWMISVLFLVLLFYLFIVQKPLLSIQSEALGALFN